MSICHSPHPALDIPAIPLAEFVLARARTRGDRAALVDSITGRTMTYAQLPEMVDRAAASLARLGLRVASYKKIRRLDFIDAIPKSPSGKILRRLLRESLIHGR